MSNWIYPPQLPEEEGFYTVSYISGGKQLVIDDWFCLPERVFDHQRRAAHMQAYAWMERIEPAPLPQEQFGKNQDSVLREGIIFRTAAGQGLFTHGKNNEKLTANNEWWFNKEEE
ncbi:hypothetical protein KC921_02750 [Candidatus Woesebacteria bacterium]|nr:hypothetical protein [Candidatus Woesebacteria bacterium]